MRLRILLEPRYGASYQQILAMAQATEEAGFDAFFRSDHYLGIDAGDASYAPTDSWATLAGLAVQTRRVRLGTLMTASTFRHPGPLAITVATVHAMSGGRAELGIGAAWFEREHQAFGIPFPATGERFDRLEEQLAILSGLWCTPPGQQFSHDGKHYQLAGCANFPVLGTNGDGASPAGGPPGFPAGRRRPQLIIGGAGPNRTPSLAARFADEFNSGLTDGLSERLANFRRICAGLGRDPAAVRLSTTLPVCCGRTRGEAAQRAAALGDAGARLLGQGVVGTPADVLGRIRELAAAGVDTVYFHIYDAADTEHVRLLGRTAARGAA
jgi:alkanesulfonate monooxygenase SsuD/methylene tetrahydromethanopterin reductase-like flavin-dependent oxidoreductase (luciferase family)